MWHGHQFQPMVDSARPRHNKKELVDEFGDWSIITTAMVHWNIGFFFSKVWDDVSSKRMHLLSALLKSRKHGNSAF